MLSYFPPLLPFNSLPNGKILDWPELKAFADDNLNVTKMMISCYNRVEYIVKKGENAGYQGFFHRVFKSRVF